MKLDKKKIVLLTCIFLGLTGSVAVIGVKKATVEKEATVQPAFESIVKQDLQKKLSVTGTIRSKESSAVSVDIQDTYIKEIKVKVGDRVKKGDVVVVLDVSEIQSLLDQANKNLQITNERRNLELSSANLALDEAKNAANLQQTRDVESLQKANDEFVNATNSALKAGNEYEKAKADRQTYDSKVTNLQKKINEYTSKLRELDTKISDQENNLSALERKKSEKRNILENTKDKYEKAKESQEVKVKEPDTESEEAENSPDGKLQELETAITNAQEEYDAANDQYNKCEITLHELQKEKVKISNESEDRQKELSQVQSSQAEAKSLESQKEAEKKSYTEKIDSAKENIQKTVLQTEDNTRSNQKSIINAQNGVTNSKLGSVSSVVEAQKEVDKYKKLLGKAEVLAPSDGVVTKINIKEGYSYKGEEMLVIQDDSSFKVATTIDQYDIGNIENGEECMISIQGINDSQMEGEVTFVSPTPQDQAATTSAQTSTGIGNQLATYPIEITIKDSNEKLKIGMLTKVTIIERQVKDALTIPDNCVQIAEDGTNYVEVMDENGNRKKITVTYGLKTDYYVQIIGKDLTEGMNIVIPTM